MIKLCNCYCLGFLHGDIIWLFPCILGWGKNTFINEFEVPRETLLFKDDVNTLFILKIVITCLGLDRNTNYIRTKVHEIIIVEEI